MFLGLVAACGARPPQRPRAESANARPTAAPSSGAVQHTDVGTQDPVESASSEETEVSGVDVEPVLSAQRRQYIADLANDEWVDRLPPDVDDARFDELSEEMELETHRFLTDETTTAHELHYFADRWNWDGGVWRMTQLIRHPRCDAGTALLVYWRARPEYFRAYPERSDVPEHARDGFDLVMEIERRYTAGEYTSRTIPFDPRAEGLVGAYDDRPVRRSLPPVMYDAVGGDSSVPP